MSDVSYRMEEVFKVATEAARTVARFTMMTEEEAYPSINAFLNRMINEFRREAFDTDKESE